MSTTAPPEVPDRATVDDTLKVIHDHADRIFLWDYDRSRGQLVTLYNKAMGSQWNSITDLDWDTDVDPERLVGTAADPNPIVEIAKRAVAIPGSPLATWGDKELTQLGIEVLKAQLSQFMHGEQGAMMVAAKIVETVPWIDAKYYAATQTMDEARHTEVFAKYLHTKLGEAYPMSPFLEEQITALIEDSRWDIAYLGMQIVIESLALAAFGGMLRAAREPLLKKLLRYVMSDEARHVAFGVLSLSEYYADMSEAELKDRQDFLLEATIRNRARSTTPEIWNRMGVDVKAVVPALKEAAASMGGSVYSGFEHSFYAKLVPNVRKLGLLDANDGHLRKAWEQHGLMRFEMADDTASVYESYDEVARDRAESGAEATA
ncbi:MAG TPA: ferritin-like domain-containing protein [Iamia sp.]|nr:ferritin-like domain-containing protein [Iamia sp.]